MPFDGFLGPSWEPATLTRILRRCTHSIMYMQNIQESIQNLHEQSHCNTKQRTEENLQRSMAQ